MLKYIVRINRREYVSERGYTVEYSNAKLFDKDEIEHWFSERLKYQDKLFKKNKLIDTDIEIILLEV